MKHWVQLTQRTGFVFLDMGFALRVHVPPEGPLVAWLCLRGERVRRIPLGEA